MCVCLPVGVCSACVQYLWRQEDSAFLEPEKQAVVSNLM